MRAALVSPAQIVLNLIEVDDIASAGVAFSDRGTIVDLAGRHAEVGDSYDGRAFARVDRRTLDEAKAAKFAAISARTDALFELGYEYPPGSGHRFSLHEDARALRTRLLVVMNTPAMTWPLVWPTLDYSAAVTLNNTTDAANFVVAESLAVRALQEGDAALKARLAAAQTVADVDAIVDSR